MPFFVGSEVTFVSGPSGKPANGTGFPDESAGYYPAALRLGDSKNPSPSRLREAKTGLPEGGSGFQALAGCEVVQFFAGTLLGRISRYVTA